MSPESKRDLTPQLVVAMTGASGVGAADLLLERSPWPVALVASDWARKVYTYECGDFDDLASRASARYAPDNLWAPISSGSVPTVGMVVLPCSAHSLAQIATGLGDNLIARAAHCHLKEKRPLILCLRETPMTSIDLENAARAAKAGATIMPLSPPFYMFHPKPLAAITARELLGAFVDRVLALLGQPAAANWGTVQ
ncbi:MAG: UbiX family flavin prenyltransferase [Desulfosarcinaceae bacterium]|nr:UbiX family flavin prenyltransferase [Desulfosarcinaceae bacterium]